MLKRLIKIAVDLKACKYPDASFLFLAGSILRDEGTAYSDLDLIVIFEKLPAAYRESFYFEGFPVEAFVHDPETLNYFLYEVDRLSGIPSLAQMILEGVEIPNPNELSGSLKKLASAVMAMGPPKLSEDEIRRMRYNLTNLVDDIREPRLQAELIASGTELYQAAADYYYRVNNLWSATGKSIPRIMKRTDAEFCRLYCLAFEDLFTRGQVEKIITLVEEILTPNGGFFFDGHRIEAPANYRKQSN